MTNLNDAIAAIQALLNGPQNARLLVLEFPHKDGPKATMLAQRLDAYEGLSRDFQFTVEVLSDDARIPLKDVQGKNVTVQLVRPDGEMRYFNGYVFEFRLVRTDGNLAFYNMVLLPWLAYLRLRHDNYLFHDQTLEQQTTDIFSDYDVADWRIQLTGADEPVTCACQFDETDYNYLHRQWEALGWHYRYEHRADGHTLVLSDDSTTALPIDGPTDEVPWQAETGSKEEDGLRNWTPVRRIVPASVSMAAFDFKNPLRPMHVGVPTLNQQGQVLNKEVYEYAGAYGFKDSAHGDRLARQRMEEIEASGKHFEADGNDRYIQPGRSFTLTGHFDAHAASNEAEPGEFLVLEVRHEAQNNYLQGNGDTAYYRNKLSCIRKTIPWRPGREFNSFEPKIYGPQTAIVVGPEGEEIYTDKYGRVKVQYHWDRVGEYNEKSSAWIRVSSAWTGNGYGFVGIPRVGQEVIVSFLDGNPDRPLITGCVYNDNNLPAWGFPEAAHQTGIQTRSSPGGGGHCEMVIHDKAGNELINIFSQKDMVRTVLNNDSTVVQGPQQTIAVTTGTQVTTVKKAVQVTSETEGIQHVAETCYEVAAKTQHIMLEAATDIILKVGQSKLHMNQDGSILLEGVTVTVKGSGKVDINP
jgi:type VI secretion system secreted protein VgrG